jgi:hypothetical protein
MNGLQSRWDIYVKLRKLKAKKLRVDPVESYTTDDVNTITDEVFRHVYRAYPTVPSPCYAEAA